MLKTKIKEVVVPLDNILNGSNTIWQNPETRGIVIVGFALDYDFSTATITYKKISLFRHLVYRIKSLFQRWRDGY